MEHQLRAALTSDETFLYALHCTTMRGLIERTWGWDEAWQRFDFKRRLGQYVVSIIEVDAWAAGAVWLESRPDTVSVIDLQILPEWQRHGIGTAVLRGVMADAARRGVPVDLAVLPDNEGARRLYERLGFDVSSFDGPFIHMRWAYAPRPPT